MEAHLRYCGQHEVSETIPNVINLSFEEVSASLAQRFDRWRESGCALVDASVDSTLSQVDFGRGSNNKVVLDSTEEIVVSRWVVIPFWGPPRACVNCDGNAKYMRDFATPRGGGRPGHGQFIATSLLKKWWGGRGRSGS
jgi:hypothetical protein